MMAARVLTEEERRRLDGAMPAARAGDGLGTTLGDAQDRIGTLESSGGSGSDARIGDLADLTTTAENTVVAAINEVDGNADAAASAAAAKYTKPAGGIPDSDMTAAVQASLGLADSGYQLPETGIPDTDLAAAVQASLAAADVALQGSAEITHLRHARVQLRGTAKTPVRFRAASAAALVTTVDGSAGLDLSTPGDGGTILINPDGAGEDTATLNAAAATSTSGASPSQNISAGADNKFMISVNGDAAEEVELTLVNCDSGAAIAAEMETQIQALGDEKAAVTVTWNAGGNGKYVITSAMLGTDSAVVITPAALGNCTEELKIGEDAGGVEVAGAGDCGDITAVTLDELCTLINGDIAGVTATNDGTYITITSATTGRTSSLVAGDSTLKTAIGLAQGAAAYGAQGLGFSTDMDDTDYLVQVTVDGTVGGSLGAMCVGVNTRTATGFELECETAASEAYVSLLITGVAAAA